MASTPEEFAYLDELGEIARDFELADARASSYGLFAAKLARSSLVADARNEVIDATQQTALNKAKESEEEDSEVLDVDAINDAEITKKLDEAETITYEFAGNVGAVAMRDQPSGIGLEPVAWPHVEQSTPPGTKLNVDLAIMMHEPAPPLTTYAPELPQATIEPVPRKGFLSRFKRQRPETEVNIKPERRGFRSRVMQVSAVGAAAVALVAGTFFVKAHSTESVIVNAPASAPAPSNPGTQPGHTETIEVSLPSTQEIAGRITNGLEARQQTKAVITIASMHAQYGSEAVDNLFANLDQ